MCKSSMSVETNVGRSLLEDLVLYTIADPLYPVLQYYFL